jgi:hypothetical protein
MYIEFCLVKQYFSSTGMCGISDGFALVRVIRNVVTHGCAGYGSLGETGEWRGNPAIESEMQVRI